MLLVLAVIHEHSYDLLHEVYFFSNPSKLKSKDDTRNAENKGVFANSDDRSVFSEWPLEFINGASGCDNGRHHLHEKIHNKNPRKHFVDPEELGILALVIAMEPKKEPLEFWSRWDLRMRGSGRLQLFRPKKEPLGLENESFWKAKAV
ncbi:uncharacterized protein G2W53_008157 [Senna tora]|uniref:Uncharacterized protein n=1 Tax=Senna tora TaxID=362788 RepID=A0A834X7Z8_9FABA|nr:uncharacterized protein G2W53_008157 [Senna tora]